MDKRDIGLGFFGLIGIAYVVSNGMMLSHYLKGRKNKVSKAEFFEADETVCLMCGDYKDPKQTYCCADCSRYAIGSINPLGGKRGGPPRGDIAKAVLTLKEYGGEMSANQWRARIKDIRPTRKELSNKGISLLVQYLNPDVYIKRQGRQNTYQIISGNCYDDWAKERYQAESFGAELKKDSCCCGATVENPCLCMEEGVMNCSAVEPKCPCYAAKDAESFEAEGLLFDDGGERYGQGFNTTNEEIYKERLIKYVLESVFAEYYTPTEEEVAEGYPEVWGDTVEEQDAANNQLQQWLSGKSIDELTSLAGGYARTKDVDLDKGWVEMWGNRKGLETDYYRGRHAESFDAEDLNYPCQICGEQAIYNFQDSTLRWDIVNDEDLNNLKYAGWSGENQNDFYCKKHANQYESGDFYKFNSEGESFEGEWNWDEYENASAIEKIKMWATLGIEDRGYQDKMKFENILKICDSLLEENNAESFEAERKPNQCMHCNEVLYEIEVWEDFRCPHCNNSIGDIYSDKISYDDYMSAESFEADSEESNVLRQIKEIIHDPSDLNTHEAFERIKYLMEEHGFATESFDAEDNYKLGNYADYEILELDTHSYLMSVGHSESEAEDLIERYEAFIEVGFENGDSPYEIGISITENERLDNEAESFEAPGEMEEEDFTPVDITQCHVCARPYEYSRIARALVQHYLKESKDGTRGWKTKGNPDGTRRTVRNIAGYQLYWFGLGALENYMEEGKISKMTPNIIELLRTAIVPNIIAGDVVQFIESMEIEDIEDTDPKFFTDFSDTWEAPDDRLRPERPSDDSGDRRKYRKKPKKPWRAETDPSE